MATKRTSTTKARVHIPPMTEEDEQPRGNGKDMLLRITPPRIVSAHVIIEGLKTSAYVQHAFSEKQRGIMEAKQKLGQQAAGKKVRTAKNFDEIYENAKHKSEEGWLGIPASAIRNAMISACRLCGIKMTHAKLSVWAEADGLDAADGTPLIRIKGEPEIHKMRVRNETGVADIRWRPMWREWSADVVISWDEDQFSSDDITNLLQRAGTQVGIGEGRPDSPKSNGLGWGKFRVCGLLDLPEETEAVQ